MDSFSIDRGRVSIVSESHTRSTLSSFFGYHDGVCVSSKHTNLVDCSFEGVILLLGSSCVINLQRGKVVLTLGRGGCMW